MKDPLYAPRYTVAEAARYIPGLSDSTLRSWCVGRTYPVKDGTRRFEPLIELADSADRRLSFANLVEAHILYGLRSNGELSIPNLRTAIQYAEERFGLTHILIHREVCHAAGSLFLERYGTLVNLSKTGQLGLRTILNAYLKRLVHDAEGLARKLYPILPWLPGRMDYLIDPKVAFGRPVLASNGVGVATIADRYEGGETLETLASDYDLTTERVEAAITYARAA